VDFATSYHYGINTGTVVTSDLKNITMDKKKYMLLLRRSSGIGSAASG
jgi:hypothetical protein